MDCEKYMREALALARLSFEEGEVPVGCVITDKKGDIIARGRNRVETAHSALRHAELEAIEEASRNLKNWRLSGCTLFVTLEPCPMCAGAILNSRVSKVVYGAKEERTGSLGSVLNLFMENYGFSPEITGGVLENECAELMREFFKEKRG